MKIHGTAKGGALSTKDFGVAFGGGAEPLDATGGTKTTDGDYKVHKFTSTGDLEIDSGSGDATWLLVGGGAGGAKDAYTDARAAGGGGAGAFQESEAGTVLELSSGQTYTITVGNGGAGGTGTTCYFFLFI